MSVMFDIFLVFLLRGTRCYADTIVRRPPSCPSPLAGKGREGVSGLNTALIEPSPYRDLSLEAKKRRQPSSEADALHMHTDLYKHGESEMAVPFDQNAPG